MTSETIVPAPADNPVTAKSPADGKERLAAAKRRAARVAAKATPKATAPKPVPIDRTKANRNFLRPDPSTPSKAQRVRDLLDQGKTVNEVAKALDDVSWSYAWDVAAAWEKKTGKVVIPSHAPKSAPKSTRRTSTRKADTK